MSEFKGTKGPVEARNLVNRETDKGLIVVEQVGGKRIATMSEHSEEAFANADLIAESFNVLHETGMRPRGLQQKIAELEKDAERYRKLRAGFSPDKTGIRAVFSYPNGDFGGCYVGGALDAAVDKMEATPR